MIRLSLNLSPYRLDLHLVRRRDFDVSKPLVPSLKDLANLRKGNKVSRFFRHIFEHKSVKKFLGANLAVIVIASPLIPRIPINRNEVFAADTKNVISEAGVSLTTDKNVQNPVSLVEVTQGFKLFHPGVDLAGQLGDPIKPIKPGRVEEISISRFDYGNSIIINHGNGFTSLYAHLSKIEVVEGQEVGLQTEIGKMGATGHATGNHLHLEIRDHGIPVNPFSVLPR